MPHLADHVVLITGAASGIGRAAALRLAADGAHVSLVDVSEEGLSETRAEVLEDNPGVTVTTTVADVSVAADVDRYVRAALDIRGRIDGFFNNAGIEGPQGMTGDYPLDGFDRVLGINLTGAFLGLKAVLTVMREQGKGAVVNTSSYGGLRGLGNQPAYAAAKHGLIGLTRNAAVEYGQFGIRVNAIAPGPIWTPMLETAMSKVSPENPRAVLEQIMQTNPSRRSADPAEVAAVVSFLLGDDAGYVNGVVLPVDGGAAAAG